MTVILNGLRRGRLCQNLRLDWSELFWTDAFANVTCSHRLDSVTHTQALVNVTHTQALVNVTHTQALVNPINGLMTSAAIDQELLLFLGINNTFCRRGGAILGKQIAGTRRLLQASR